MPDLASPSGWIGKLAWDFFWSKFKENTKLTRMMDQIIAVLGASERKILVFGQGGCGKTTLKRMFDAQQTEHYEPSKKKEVVFARSLESVIEAYPGQKPEFRAKRSQIEDDLANSRYVGAVHVVSYGYISPLTSFEQTEDYDSVRNKDQAVQRWLNNRRNDDLVYLEEMKQPLMFAGEFGLKWLRTLVTKADLWYPERDAAMAHYSSDRARSDDAYGAGIRSILTHRGDCSHAVLELALRASHMRDRGDTGKVLCRTSFDGRDVASSWEQFLTHMRGLTVAHD